MPLEIPYLEQNIAQPEIPENEAKDIIDAAIAGILSITTIINTNYDLKLTNTDGTQTYPYEWQYGTLVIENIAHTIDIDLILPESAIKNYVVHNKTPVNITITQYGANTVVVPTNAIYYIYCDGLDVWRIT